MNIERVILICFTSTFVCSSLAIDFRLDELRSLVEKATSAQAKPQLPEEAIKEITVPAADVVEWSKKIESAILRLDVRKNAIGNETAELILKEMGTSVALRRYDKRIERTRASISLKLWKEEFLNARLKEELKNYKKALKRVKQRENERPAWYCFLWCYWNWEKEQSKKILKAKEKCLAADKILKNIDSSIAANRNDMEELSESLTNFTTEHAKIISSTEKSRNELLQSANITDTMSTIVKCLSYLQLAVQQLIAEMKRKAEYASVKINWTEIESSLRRITAYINDDGLVDDLARWGIYIKGFDVDSIKRLGVNVDVATAALLGMS